MMTKQMSKKALVSMTVAVLVLVIGGSSIDAEAGGNGNGSSVLLRRSRKQQEQQRALQQASGGFGTTAIAGSQFVPQSMAAYNKAAMIDVDQKAMESQLALGTLDAFRTAQEIYQNGITTDTNTDDGENVFDGMDNTNTPQSQQSRDSNNNNGGGTRVLQQEEVGEEAAVARLTLRVPLAEGIFGGTKVAGAALTGDGITGVVHATAFVGQTVLYVRYDDNTGDDDTQSQSFSGATPLSLTCRVDGTSQPEINGCLMPTAVLLVGDDPSNLSSVAYTYDIIRDNSIVQLPQQDVSGGGSVGQEEQQQEEEQDNENAVAEIEEVTSTTTTVPVPVPAPVPVPVPTPSTGSGAGTVVDTTATTTLQSLSTTVQSSTTTTDIDVVHPHLKKFVNLYGRYDYADAWVTQAFQGGKFVFGQSSPTIGVLSADFTNYAAVGRTECIQKATAYMTVWMQVILNMENAVVQSCSSASSAIESWNMAVGYYVGSLTGSQGDNGNLLYTLADKRCENFATCGIDGAMTEGTSKANLEIMELFTQGQDLLVSSQSFLPSGCASSGGSSVEMNTQLRTIKENLVRSMTVPLLQGALRYAYIQANDPNRAGLEKIEAEKVVFTGSILPMVYECSPDDALIIYENTLGSNRDSPDYLALKGAYERNYGCLGVTCDDVGGLFDSDTNGYLAEAEPCIEGQIPSAPAGSESPSAASKTTSWLSKMMVPTFSTTKATLIMGTSAMISFLL